MGAEIERIGVRCEEEGGVGVLRRKNPVRDEDEDLAGVTGCNSGGGAAGGTTGGI